MWPYFKEGSLEGIKTLGNCLIIIAVALIVVGALALVQKFIGSLIQLSGAGEPVTVLLSLVIVIGMFLPLIFGAVNVYENRKKWRQR